MAGRSSTTYAKRQKELARQDKQREKAAKRAQRKLQKQEGPAQELEAGNPPDEIVAGVEGEN